jgi:hypothetical protein
MVKSLESSPNRAQPFANAMGCPSRVTLGPAGGVDVAAGSPQILDPARGASAVLVGYDNLDGSSDVLHA